MKKRDKKEDIFWFRAKPYGWGWYPSSWQGWLIFLAYVLIVVLAIPIADTSVFLFVSWVILFALILLFICYKKGEKPCMRWGKKDSCKTRF
jgi:uncharacterized membrane protein YhaH (DUF805 family)